MGKELSDKTSLSSVKTLLKGDTRKYWDKYVAISDFNSQEVVAYGGDVSKVIDEARKIGIKRLVVFYVPNPNVTYIYSAA